MRDFKRFSAIAMIVASLISIAAALVAYRYTRDAAPLTIGDGINGPKDMVWIPAGEFTMGSNHRHAMPNEGPAHKVRLSGYWVDRYDVTNACNVASEASGPPSRLGPSLSETYTHMHSPRRSILKLKRILFLLLAATGMAAAAGVAVAHGTAETVKPNFSHTIPNIPGKSIVAVEVLYPPGGASLPHRHAKSAFIYAYVVSGSIASKVNEEPERIYKAGESFYEEPGSRHLVSRNASKTQPAKLLAIFVVNSDDEELTTNDK